MYKPLPRYVKIKESGIHGVGLFASKPIRKGTVLGISHVKDERFENGYIRTPLGGFINHSETPNCDKTEENDFIIITANKNIEKGTELTIKYTLYEI